MIAQFSGQCVQPIGRGSAIIVGEGQVFSGGVSRAAIPGSGWSALFLPEDEHVEIFFEVADGRFDRGIGSIVDYDHIESMRWILQAGERLETGGELGHASMSRNNN